MNYELGIKKMNKEQYNELFGNIWKKTLPYIGAITIEGIFRRLIKKREMQYPFLSKIILSENGFDLSNIVEIGNWKLEIGGNIEEGLNLIILDFYKFLEEMTGNLITNEIEGMIKELRIKN